MILKVKGVFGMTTEQRTDIEEMLSTNFGTAATSGKPLIVGDTVTVEQFPVPQVGDLPEHRQIARDETLAVFGVPPPIAGVMDNATLQNASVALRLYWMQALRPRIGRILDAINTQAVEPVYGRDTRIWFELADNELGLAILQQRAEVAKVLHRDLDYSTNDSAERVGLNMPKPPELDEVNSQARIAGREETD